MSGRQAAAVVRSTQLAAGRQDGRTAAPMDRAVHAASAKERRIRGIDDRVDVLLGDVAE
jgi:hypothetical protein